MTLEQYKDFSNAFMDACKKDGCSLYLRPHQSGGLFSSILARNGTGYEIILVVMNDYVCDDIDYGFGFHFKGGVLLLSNSNTDIDTFEKVLKLETLKKNIKFFLLSNLNLIG